MENFMTFPLNMDGFPRSNDEFVVSWVLFPLIHLIL